MSVPIDWTREYIADRRLLRDEPELTDYFADLMVGSRAKLKHHGAVEPLAQWHEETRRLRFNVDSLPEHERQAVGIYLARKLYEAMNSPERTPFAMSMPEIVNELARVFPHGVQAPRSLSDVRLTRFGSLPIALEVSLPRQAGKG